jgi:DNA/RNA-binding domain of Phe-tRNA-synthetase-like protein
MKNIKINVNPEVFQLFPELKIGFVLVKDFVEYSSESERDVAENYLLNFVKNRYENEKILESHYLNTYYQDFFRKIGIKPSDASTPIKQVKRILKKGEYKSRFKIIDTYLSVEYASLISFQVYDYSLIDESINYFLGTGEEKILTFSGDIKTCKPGELLMSDINSIINSSYYGNNKNYAVGNTTTSFLLRILGIPGLQSPQFDAAIRSAENFSSNTVSIIVEKDNPEQILKEF